MGPKAGPRAEIPPFNMRAVDPWIGGCKLNERSVTTVWWGREPPKRSSWPYYLVWDDVDGPGSVPCAQWAYGDPADPFTFPLSPPLSPVEASMALGLAVTVRPDPPPSRRSPYFDVEAYWVPAPGGRVRVAARARARGSMTAPRRSPSAPPGWADASAFMEAAVRIPGEGRFFKEQGRRIS
jgi:hypothetical protein